MTRNRRLSERLRVQPNVVPAAMVVQLATICSKMSLEIATVHNCRLGTRAGNGKSSQKL